MFREKGQPTTNNPDDIPKLQELARADAELHLAYAADLFSNGQKSRAATQWESGCIRLEAYVGDGLARLEEERKLKNLDVRKELGENVPGPSIATLGTNINARFNGLDPDSPYVTQRPGQR